MIKPKREAETLGERLRKHRESLRLTVKDLADELQAPQKYIQALEEDRFEVFSAKVYGLGYLRKLLPLLSIEDGKAVEREFSNEWDVQMFRDRKELRALPQNRGIRPWITPARLGLGGAGLLLLLFLALLGVRLFRFVGAPSLSLEEPQDRVVLTMPIVRVKGTTEKESKLTVNGRELTIDGAGHFDQEIELSAGLNALEFLVQNRFGKETKIIRYIVVK